MPDDPLTLFRLDGKVAVVTGGARGIGRATAATLAAAGAAVALLDRDGEAAEPAARALGNAVSAHAVDVGDEAAVEAGVGAGAKGHGGSRVLVHGGGVGMRPTPRRPPPPGCGKGVAVTTCRR